MIRAVRPALVVLVIVCGVTASVLVGRAQSASTGSPDILSALLTEVRALRTTMEQMATAGPRVQLALGRLQIQEQRVAELTRRLDGTRKSLGDAQVRLQAESGQWKMFEEALSQQTQTDPNERREVEQAMKHMKLGREQVLAEIQRLQMDEASQAQDLANEQGRWAQLNQQVEEVERSLGRRQP